MKALISFCFLIIFSPILLNAQITINQSDLPASGDAIIYSAAWVKTPFNFDETGPNFQWDYSELKPVSQGVDEYKSITNFWMAITFSSGAIQLKMDNDLPLDDIEIDIGDMYSVFHKNSARYINEGFFIEVSPIPLPLKYSQPDVVYRFPLNYQDSDSIYFTGTRNVGDTLSLTREGYRKNETDGWGTITTPFGEFECLRVKSILYESDSLYWSSLPEPIIVKRTHLQYKWLAKGQKMPILEVRFLMVDDDPADLMPVMVKYRDITREVVLPQAPVAGFLADKTEAFVNESISLLNNSTPGHNDNIYIWTITPGENVGFENETGPQSSDPVISISQPGSYSIKLLAENYSGLDSLTIENYLLINKDETSITEGLITSNQPRIFLTSPGKLRIENNNRISRINILDITGRIVINTDGISSPETELNIFPLKPGNYIIQVFEEKSPQLPVLVKIYIP